MWRMADPTASSQELTSTTVTAVVPTDAQDYQVPTLHLKLKKPKTDRKVQWTTETVDNECMNRKKSKCCCIYKKPKDFGESSSSENESDDECDHCKGHVDKKRNKEGTSCTPTENGTTVMVLTETDSNPAGPSGDSPKKPEDALSSDPPPP